MSGLFNLVKKEISALSKISENRQIRYIISKINMKTVKKAASSKKITGAEAIKMKARGASGRSGKFKR